VADEESGCQTFLWFCKWFEAMWAGEKKRSSVVWQTMVLC